MWVNIPVPWILWVLRLSLFQRLFQHTNLHPPPKPALFEAKKKEILFILGIVFGVCSAGGLLFFFLLCPGIPLHTRVFMEVSNYLVSWVATYLGDLQPTYYIGVIIYLLSTSRTSQYCFSSVSTSNLAKHVAKRGQRNVVCHQWDRELQSRSSSFAFTGAYGRRRLNRWGQTWSWGGTVRCGFLRVDGNQKGGGWLEVTTCLRCPRDPGPGSPCENGKGRNFDETDKCEK